MSIAQDEAVARSLGLSYGEYKGQQRIGQIPPREKNVCALCGKPMKKTRKIYCSDECQKNSQRMRKAGGYFV